MLILYRHPPLRLLIPSCSLPIIFIIFDRHQYSSSPISTSYSAPAILNVRSETALVQRGILFDSWITILKRLYTFKSPFTFYLYIPRNCIQVMPPPPLCAKRSSCDAGDKADVLSFVFHWLMYYWCSVTNCKPKQWRKHVLKVGGDRFISLWCVAPEWEGLSARVHSAWENSIRGSGGAS